VIKKTGFFARATGTKSGELYIYQEIGNEDWGGISAKTVAAELKKLGNVAELNIYLNSPGGGVFEGFAIYQQLMRHTAKKTVYVDGLAASIASVILLAADRRIVAENASMMIHDPWGFAMGSAADMRKSAEALDKVRDSILDTYVARTGYDRKKLSDMMAAETWFDAKEAKKYGFATELMDANVNNSCSFSLLAKYKNTPQNLRGPALSASTRIAEMNMHASQIARNLPRASSEP
jgi:ATP-dependent Clp protease protease subunit